jgi:hypothetical protein
MKNREALEVKNLKMLEQRVEEVISALRIFFDQAEIKSLPRHGELIIELQQGEVKLSQKILLRDFEVWLMLESHEQEMHLDNLKMIVMDMLGKKPELINEEDMLIRLSLESTFVSKDIQKIRDKVMRKWRH